MSIRSKAKNTVRDGLGLDKVASEIKSLSKVKGIDTSGVETAKQAFKSMNIETKKTVTQLSEIKSEATRMKPELDKISSATKDTGDTVKKATGYFGQFTAALKRIALYRFVRFILKSITTAAREGIQNLAQYSAAIGGIDASRANATMSQFATMALQVKNSVGAALMPVLRSLMPVIQTLADWFIIAANAVNQFFSAISGATTFTKAKAATVDYAKSLGSATKAAKELKNAMLGIDELNVVSPASSGGASGGAGAGMPAYSEMFEEVQNQTLRFAEKIRISSMGQRKLDDILKTRCN